MTILRLLAFDRPEDHRNYDLTWCWMSRSAFYHPDRCSHRTHGDGQGDAGAILVVNDEWKEPC
ncbi:MAG: hypothetical protein PHW04_04830 [Candidatus Wallbacteria bacterium]|nr:hypothetical protein [Candidatus Wallbacteria bacterium]